MTRVIAVNSSPHRDNGYTHLILKPFLEGIRLAGGDVELFYTRDLTINPCLADIYCWGDGDGTCSQDDDMRMLLPKLADATIWILATPLYFSGVSGQMKNFMDRLLPLGLPKVVVQYGHTGHPVRKPILNSKVVLVTNCGLYERDNFDAILSHIRAFCKNVGREFAGALIRPHGWVVGKEMPEDIVTAAKNAGRQLIKEGTISPEYFYTVSRDLISTDAFLKKSNTC